MAGVTDCSRSILSLAVVVAVIAAAGNYGVVVAQLPAPASGCAASMASLSPCVRYMATNASTSPPPQACCTALSSVAQNSAMCLCQLFTSNNPLGVPINQTRALALPGACKTTAPPISQCKAAAGGPAPSAGAPAPSASAGAPAPSASAGAPAPSASAAAGAPAPSAGAPAPSASAGSKNGAPTKRVPSSPATSTSKPPAVSPSSKSPSFVPPTTSVRGESPSGSEAPTSSTARALFIPSAIISVLAAGAIVVITF